MVYCLTSCLDFLLLPTLLFEFPVCFILKAPLCVSSHAFHFLSFLVFPPFSLSAPPWLVTPVSWEPFPSKYFPPVCSMAAMLQCGLSKHFLYCLSVPGVFLEFLLCTFLHFAWFWIFGFLPLLGWICMFMDSFPGFDPHLPHKWWVEYWSEPALPVMSVNICLFVVKYGCSCDPTHVV